MPNRRQNNIAVCGRFVPLGARCAVFPIVFLMLCLLLTASFFAALLVVTPRAQAQGSLLNTRSYVTPFPDGDRYQLYVFGDALADGIWGGLAGAFANTGMVAPYKQTKRGSGFTNIRRFNWNRTLDNLLNVNKAHIAVVMIGSVDNKPIWFKRRKYEFMSPEWKKIYTERVDKFMKRLKRAKTAVYWVGMPIMLRGPYNAQMQSINDLFRERAFLNGIKFIDTWNGFTDQFGNYAVYGPDLSGRMRRLRANDGVHFTPHGYRKLAHFIEREIRKDLKSARQERDIPLAGAPDEQRRISGREPLETAHRAPQRKTKPTPPARSNDARANRRASRGQKQNKGKGRSTRLTPVKNPLHGETIANEMSIGLTALASVSSLNDTSTKEGHRRLPLAQRPYFKVLEKGQALRPKLNRSDDFTWSPADG